MDVDIIQALIINVAHKTSKHNSNHQRYHILDIARRLQNITVREIVILAIPPNPAAAPTNANVPLSAKVPFLLSTVCKRCPINRPKAAPTSSKQPLIHPYLYLYVYTSRLIGAAIGQYHTYLGAKRERTYQTAQRCHNSHKPE